MRSSRSLLLCGVSLLVLFVQIGCDLFSDDEIALPGPLTAVVASDGWVVLHLIGVAWYRWCKQSGLVSSVPTGDKRLAQPVRTNRDTASARISSLVILALRATVVNRLVALGR